MHGLASSASRRLHMSPIVARVFSTQMKEVPNDSYAIEKLRNALNQYRRENYQRETISRFRKDLISVAIPGVDFTRSQDYHVNIDTINTILGNIGVPEKLTTEELDSILRDAGIDANKDRSIPLMKMMNLL